MRRVFFILQNEIIIFMSEYGNSVSELSNEKWIVNFAFSTNVYNIIELIEY